MPPRLSTGSVALVDVRRDEAQRQHERDHGERQRDQEDRAPPEVLEQERRRASGPSAAIAPPSADHSAIDLRAARPRPQRGDQRERRRVGHAGREPAAEPRATKSTRVGRRVGGEQARRDRQHHPEDAASACGRTGRRARRGRAPSGQPERVADRDQVERRSATSRSARRSTAARRSRRTGSGWRPRRRGSARRARVRRAPARLRVLIRRSSSWWPWWRRPDQPPQARAAPRSSGRRATRGLNTRGRRQP